ncbi:MAG: DNA gyrase C-terminal beta-propeller domain-containing protein, partial [Armatimonadota bacterium]|nr:DNA gyrase C-terminal beta-propeller domain-containing protein [Armatimonadota bacterium]
FVLTAKGIGIHIRLSEVRCCGRSTQGVKLINLEEGDWVSSVAIMARKEEDEEDNR